MKSYGQYCGLARSLEVVGNRWNLLVVRQLLIGPARYRDLLDGLPGIATNLLADRLRDLEAAGVVERRPGGRGSTVEYALTPWGAELRTPIEDLIRWSTPLMVRGPEGDRFRPEWLTVALPALLRTRVRRTTTVGLEVGEGQLFQLRATRSGVAIDPHDGRDLDATVHTSAHVLLGLASGALTLEDAQALGAIEIEGDPAAVRTVLGD
ncbi:winged helix-turn-helix transcriptional regulator [Nocardioides humi]|uniref:Winged helix-turn-helix transcriptional regulator n=1 Tax=Nocardioides humi TaxID=449461 RepID=A0ABN2A9S6_9ACTN|nr:winged helix-turn-helix transcriptional regulator [Nocardioides humi]